jgi:hypothetical protein
MAFHPTEESRKNFQKNAARGIDEQRVLAA